MKNESLSNPEEREGDLNVSKSYQDVAGWKAAMASVAGDKPMETYARYGYPELSKRENEIAKLVGTEEVLLYNDGMAAVTAATENLCLTKGDVILYSPSIYGQSKTYIENLGKKGVKCIPIKSGDAKLLEAAIEKNNPRAIFTETVGNAADMPVVDIEALLKVTGRKNAEYQSKKSFKDELGKKLEHTNWIKNWLDVKPGEEIGDMAEKKLGGLVKKFEKTGRDIDKKHSLLPLKDLCGEIENLGINIEGNRHNMLLELQSILNSAWLAKREAPLTVIFDNTIPTETGLDMPKEIKGAKTPVLVAESGTKFFAKDTATLGIVYSNSKESMAQLEVERAITGGYLPKNSEASLPEQAKESFDERNKRILRNTKILAESLARLAGKIGIDAVVHPNLPAHPNYKYANEKMPDGATSLFYVVCKNAWETAQELEKAGLKDKVDYGGSFGFDKTRFAIFFDDKVLRIAGGDELPEEFLKILDVIKGIK